MEPKTRIVTSSALAGLVVFLGLALASVALEANDRIPRCRAPEAEPSALPALPGGFRWRVIDRAVVRFYSAGRLVVPSSPVELLDFQWSEDGRARRLFVVPAAQGEALVLEGVKAR